MSRSNYDKPFYVDVGTSVVAIRCASNHDVIAEYDYVWHPSTLELAKKVCDRMNKEAEIGRPRRNCDVGTVTEQIGRFENFCGRYKQNCERCPLAKDDSKTLMGCAIKWSQMPYEEGGEE